MSDESTQAIKASETLVNAGTAADAKGKNAVDAVVQPCPLNCPPPLAKRNDDGKVDIDWKFISDREGGQQLNGYVPASDKSKSGVTIGTGVDLGARSGSDIDKLDISDDLKAKLKPYVGKQKSDAQNYLDSHPLTLTDEEASALDKSVKQPILNGLVKDYNSAVDTANTSDGYQRVHFEQLPQSVQTAVVSTSFQYGSLSTATPNYWKQVTEQRWQDASDNLKNFGDAYPTRRKLEAGLLDASIDSAAVPAPPAK